MLLSIVIPFFNTFDRSESLRRIIKRTLTENKDIEFILVNDGSVDATFSKLIDYYKEFSKSSCLKIIDQENKGPGGARNNGLKNATGKYIWFVDSDDNIDISNAYERLQQAIELDVNFDFIDFNIRENNKITNSMGNVESGYYPSFENKYLYLGRIVTKIFCRDVFIINNVTYPEKVIYEDNYLIYILPIFLNNFFKFNDAVYEYVENQNSITRQKFNRKYYDRLLTSYEGLENHYYLNNKKIEEGVLVRFNEIFYENTLLYIIDGVLKGEIDKRELMEVKKIIEWCNFLKKKYNFKFIISNKRSFKIKILFEIIYILSIFFGSKDWYSYFLNLNKEEWKIK